MKKVLFITNVVTLVLLSITWFAGCECPDPPPPPPPPPVSACAQPVDNGTFTMNSELAIQMVAQYTKDHWEDVNNSNNSNSNTTPVANIKDSRSIWFSLSRLKGFIQAIENNAALNMTGNCCENLGVRIYLAEYNKDIIEKFNDESQGQFDPTYTGLCKTTILMVPTYRMSDGKNHDFNPLHSYTCNVTDTSGLSWGPTMLALTMNHGGIAPPPYPSKLCMGYKNCGADFMVYAVDPKPVPLTILNASGSSNTVNPYYFATPPGSCNDY